METMIPVELGFADGRFAELFLSLCTVAGDFKEPIIEYAKSLYAEKTEEEAASFNAEVLNHILSFESNLERNNKGQYFTTKAVAKKFNESRLEKEQWKTESVGHVIAGLGFTRTRSRDGSHAFLWEPQRIKKLKKQFSVEDVLGEPSKPSRLSKVDTYYAFQ